MKRSPWWAPDGYKRGAYGFTAGQWWGMAVPPRKSGLPTIVMVGEHRVGVQFPWWARGVTLRREFVKRMLRAGVLK